MPSDTEIERHSRSSAIAQKLVLSCSHAVAINRRRCCESQLPDSQRGDSWAAWLENGEFYGQGKLAQARAR